MQHNYDIFEKYLNGELEGQSLSDFEQQLKSDQNLASEFKLFQKVRDGLATKIQSHSGKEALLKTIGNIEGQYFKEGEQSSDEATVAGPRLVSRRFIFTAMAVAASILLLVFVWQPWQSALSPYDQYAQFPTADFTSRSTDVHDLQAMQNAYNNKEYAEAITLFDQYLSVNDDAEIIMLNGISNLNIGNHNRANELFTEVISGKSTFIHDAAWYLALSYLKQDNTALCIQTLNSIPQGADKYSIAQELLSKLQ